MDSFKTGIIVHSQTGNTLSVAEKLREKLMESGKTTEVQRMMHGGNEQEYIKNMQNEKLPDASEYSIIAFGAPVNGFSLSPLMKAYLKQIPSLEGKKVLCYVTQFFPYEWMGGNRALSQLKIICESKGAQVMETGIINWSRKKRNEMINELIQKFIGYVQ